MSTPPKKEIKHILKQVAAGKEWAFRELFKQYKDKIFSFTLYLTHSEALAEEITQEIFIKIWIHREQLNEITHFNSWLNTIVRNQAYTVLVRMAHEKRILEELSYRSEKYSRSTENKLLSQEYDILLKQAIEQLPPQQKKVYLLSRKEGLKQARIAEKMGLSIHTVKNHMKAALHTIRLFFEAHKEVMLFFLLCSIH